MSTSHRTSRRRMISSALSSGALAASSGRLLAAGKPATLTPYLLFDGHCQQAMEFYQACFGGELNLTKVKDSPVKNRMPETQHGKVLNARLKCGTVDISASDWLRPDRTPIRGNTACLYLSGSTLPQLKALFEKLADGADVIDPLQPTFFGSYGALTDKFGVRWMFQSDERQ